MSRLSRPSQSSQAQATRERWSPGSVLLIDYETTGLQLGEGPEAWHEPVEVAVVRVCSLTRREIGAWSRLIRPLHPERADPRAMRIHGLRAAALAAAPEAAAVVTAFERWCWSRPAALGTSPASVPGRVALVAHNAAFDRACHGMLLSRAGYREDRHGTFTCTARSDLLVPHGPSGRTYSRRLSDLAQRAGIARSHQHRALGDARLLLSLIQRVPQARWDAFAAQLGWCDLPIPGMLHEEPSGPGEPCPRTGLFPAET